MANLKQENELLNRKIAHFQDDKVYGANFVKELKRLIAEYETWYEKRIKKYVNGEGNNGVA